MNEKKPTYVIRNWAQHYETHETKKLRRLTWLPTPNKHDGRGFRRLMRLPNGPAIYGAWILIAQVASKMPVRGVLADEDGPLDAEDLSDKTGAPQELFVKALSVLSSPELKICWLDTTKNAENLPTRRENLPPSPDVSGESAALLPASGNEGKGMEGKGREGTEGADVVFEPDPMELQPRVRAFCKRSGFSDEVQAMRRFMDMVRLHGPEPVYREMAAAKRGDKPWAIEERINGSGGAGPPVARDFGRERIREQAERILNRTERAEHDSAGKAGV